jgi:hypothetical protein
LHAILEHVINFKVVFKETRMANRSLSLIPYCTLLMFVLVLEASVSTSSGGKNGEPKDLGSR